MKNETYEFVQRIEKHYVGEDCVQIMMPHNLKSGVTLLNSEEIIYHYKPNSQLFVNKYPNDVRKNQFPYAEIPIHKSKVGLKTLEYANQLLDFNRVYIEITNGVIIENYVVKDDNEAIVATKFIIPNEKVQPMNRDEVLKLLQAANGGTFSPDGEKWLDYKLTTEEEILEWYKKRIIKKRKEEEDTYCSISEELSEYVYKNIDKLTINDVPGDITIYEDAILVNIEDKEIKSIKSIVVKFISTNNYIVEIYDFPITIYSLEHMKKLEQTNKRKTSEPKFPRRLNKEIKKEELKKVKKLILERKK